MSEVIGVLQDAAHGAGGSMARSVSIEPFMDKAELTVSVHGGIRNLFFSEKPCDPRGPHASGAEVEDPLDNLCRLLVGHNLFVVVPVLTVAVGRPRCDPFAAFPPHPRHKAGFPADLAWIPLISNVFLRVGTGKIKQIA